MIHDDSLLSLFMHIHGKLSAVVSSVAAQRRCMLGPVHELRPSAYAGLFRGCAHSHRMLLLARSLNERSPCRQVHFAARRGAPTPKSALRFSINGAVCSDERHDEFCPWELMTADEF